ncbi:MAG TPA: GNAT family N-acetyltransferase [Methylomirabilota bacterium]|nr:GNAT family N-acetyltransferase [Methylomirabilota bacterium]
MNTTKYQIHTIKNLEETLIKEWKQLWEQAENATIFNSYEWFVSCQEVEKFKEYEIHVCYKDDKLVGLLPLQASYQFGIKVMSVVGKAFLVDTPFLLQTYDASLLEHFFKHIITKKNIYLQKIDNQAASLLQILFPKMFFPLMSVNPYITITDDPFASVSPSTVSQIKKMLRKNPGQFRFEIFDGEIDLEKHLQTMFAVEQNSSKKQRSMDIFSKQQNKDFFTAISKNAKKFVRIGFLYYDTIPISYQFGFLCSKEFIAYQTSYLNEYRKLRPGKTMLFHLLQSLKEQVRIIDLGGGISAYKQEFTPDYHFLYDMYYSRNLFIMLWWKFINIVRRLKQIIFPQKFTQDHRFLFKPYSLQK